jgi:hypothetical protein
VRDATHPVDHRATLSKSALRHSASVLRAHYTGYSEHTDRFILKSRYRR